MGLPHLQPGRTHACVRWRWDCITSMPSLVNRFFSCEQESRVGPSPASLSFYLSQAGAVTDPLQLPHQLPHSVLDLIWDPARLAHIEPHVHFCVDLVHTTGEDPAVNM